MQPTSCSDYLGAMMAGPIAFGWFVYSLFAIFRFITLHNFKSDFGPFHALLDLRFYKGLGFGLLWLLLLVLSVKILPFWGFNVAFLVQMIWVSRRSSTQECPKVELRLMFSIPLIALPWWFVIISTSETGDNPFSTPA